MKHSHLAIRTPLALATAVLLVACGGSDPVAPPPPVATITLAPTQRELAVGETVELQVTLRDANGNALTDRTVTWTTSASNVASVSTNGLVTALTPGTAIIIATSEGKAAPANIVVRAPVSTVAIDATSQTVGVGETLQLTARTLSATGEILNRPVTWSSSNQGVATVATNGLVTGVSGGTTTITATSEGRTAQLTITASAVRTVEITIPNYFMPINGSDQLTMVARDAGGAVVTGGTRIWSSSNLARATVSQTGFLNVLQFGAFNIVGQVDGKSTTREMFGAPLLGNDAPIAFDLPRDFFTPFVVQIPANATRLTVTTQGNNGDADLYVLQPRQGPLDDNTEFDCVEANDNSNEQCVLDNPRPGYWSVLVYAWVAFNNLTLRAVVTTTTGDIVVEMTPGARSPLVTHIPHAATIPARGLFPRR